MHICCNAGDGNCFYRAFMVALMENICADPNPATCQLLLAVLRQLFTCLKGWEGVINGSYYFIVSEGYYRVKVAAHAFLTAQSSNAVFCMHE